MIGTGATPGPAVAGTPISTRCGLIEPCENLFEIVEPEPDDGDQS
jgi:hypothetical protein